MRRRYTGKSECFAASRGRSNAFSWSVRLSFLVSPKILPQVATKESDMRKFREISGTSSPHKRFEVQMTGPDLFNGPFLKKGDAFPPEERAALGRTGLLPEAVTTPDEQVK